MASDGPTPRLCHRRKALIGQTPAFAPTDTLDDKLRALAVGMAQRSPLLPEVPSLAEAGLPDAAYTFWVGLFAPAQTPADVSKRLHNGVVKVLA